MPVEVPHVGAQQRLPAGETHRQTAQFGGLVQDILDLLGRHLARLRVGVVRRAIDATVDAIVVASLSQLDVEFSRRGRRPRTQGCWLAGFLTT